MTVYDTSTDARTSTLGADIDATRERLLDDGATTPGSRVKQALSSAPGKAGQAVRRRPGTTAATTLLLIVATVAGTVGARKIAEARRPRNRWQALLRR